MTEEQINNLNNQISYEHGKIYNDLNKGFTSKLMQELGQYGYRASTSGAMHYLHDDKGRQVTHAGTWEGLLLNTAIVMR